MGKSSTLAYRQTRKRKEKKKMKEETSIIVRVGGQWATGRVRCPTSMHPHTHASASSAAMDTEQRRFEDKKSCWLHLQRRKRKRGGREGGELVGRNINHTVVLEPPSFFHPLRPGAMTGNSPAEAMHRLEFFFFCPIFFFLPSYPINPTQRERENDVQRDDLAYTRASS